MNPPKVFISTYPFGKYDPTPIRILEEKGFEILKNPYTRKLKPEEVAELAEDVDAIIAGTENLTELIERNKKLQLISRVGIGLDSVPLQLCKDKGIVVAYTPDAVTMAVAELTIGLMIDVSRKVQMADREMRKGGWSRFVGKRLGESVIGIIGAGRVGLNVIRLLSEFYPKEILIQDLKDKSKEVAAILDPKRIKYSFFSKEEIYRRSDLVSLHVPLTKHTRKMITKKELELFSTDAYLLNTARGELIEEADLIQALSTRKLAGAAIDVFSKEPYSGELTQLENVVLTEHMGSCSYDCRLAMEREASEEVIRFYSGEALRNEVPAEEYEYQE